MSFLVEVNEMEFATLHIVETQLEGEITPSLHGNYFNLLSLTRVEFAS